MTELIKVTYNNDRPADCRTNPIHRIKENAMEKKYILTDDVIDFNDHTLHRIKAVRDFDCVKAGDLGGFIESEKNLDHDGDAWVSDNARVFGDAMVFGYAKVSGDAMVFGDAGVFGDARVPGNAKVHESSDIALIKGFGSEFRATSFFRCADGFVRCQCGCFYGTVDEFRSKVRETHGSSKYAKEYLMIADLMELHFKEE